MSDHESETEEQQELDLTKVCLEAPLLPDRRPHTDYSTRPVCCSQTLLPNTKLQQRSLTVRAIDC